MLPSIINSFVLNLKTDEIFIVSDYIEKLKKERNESILSKDYIFNLIKTIKRKNKIKKLIAEYDS